MSLKALQWYFFLYFISDKKNAHLFSWNGSTLLFIHLNVDDEANQEEGEPSYVEYEEGSGNVFYHDTGTVFTVDLKKNSLMVPLKISVFTR